MIIAYGLFIFGFLGFLGSMGDAKKLIAKYGAEIEIPTNKRVVFHVLVFIEVLLMLCSAQYIWG